MGEGKNLGSTFPLVLSGLPGDFLAVEYCRPIDDGQDVNSEPALVADDLELAEGKSRLPVNNLTLRVLRIELAEATALDPRGHAGVVGVENVRQPMGVAGDAGDTGFLPFTRGGVSASRPHDIAVLDEEAMKEHGTGLYPFDSQFLESQQVRERQVAERDEFRRPAPQKLSQAVFVVSPQEISFGLRSGLANLSQRQVRRIDVRLEFHHPRRVLVEPGQLVEIHHVPDDEYDIGMIVAQEGQGATKGRAVDVRSVQVGNEDRPFIPFHVLFHLEYPP